MNTQWIMHSPIGPLYLVASDKGLRMIYWNRQADPLTANLHSESTAVETLKSTVRQLEEYFQGKRTEFQIPLDVEGTAFQKRVWEELKKIPYGQTISYRTLSERIGNPKAARAVGSANGKNPLSIIVPCHRVIAADGSLGGYAGGLPGKKALLDLERSLASVPPCRTSLNRSVSSPSL